MLLSSFIAGLSGNPGQQVRFQTPPIVDEAHQIAITVFEAEAQEKRNVAFFPIPKPTRRVEVTVDSPGKSLEDQSTVRQLALARTRRMQAGSSVSDILARLTLAAKESCFVLSVGNQDTAKDCFLNKFPPRKNEGNNQYPKSQGTGKSSSTYAEAARRNTHRQENL
jgi:hypothetical protein